MKFSSIVARRKIAGISAGLLLGGLGIGTVGAPSAAAAPDCSPEGVRATVSSVTGEAQQYLAGHPGAGQVVSAAYGQPRGEAAANIRAVSTHRNRQNSDALGGALDERRSLPGKLSEESRSFPFDSTDGQSTLATVIHSMIRFLDSRNRITGSLRLSLITIKAHERSYPASSLFLNPLLRASCRWRMKSPSHAL